MSVYAAGDEQLAPGVWCPGVWCLSFLGVSLERRWTCPSIAVNGGGGWLKRQPVRPCRGGNVVVGSGRMEIGAEEVWNPSSRAVDGYDLPLNRLAGSVVSAAGAGAGQAGAVNGRAGGKAHRGNISANSRARSRAHLPRALSMAPTPRAQVQPGFGQKRAGSFSGRRGEKCLGWSGSACSRLSLWSRSPPFPPELWKRLHPESKWVIAKRLR